MQYNYSSFPHLRAPSMLKFTFIFLVFDFIFFWFVCIPCFHFQSSCIQIDRANTTMVELYVHNNTNRSQAKPTTTTTTTKRKWFACNGKENVRSFITMILMKLFYGENFSWPPPISKTNHPKSVEGRRSKMKFIWSGTCRTFAQWVYWILHKIYQNKCISSV